MIINAVETVHAGCRFRSRLEARWAVFFDALGIRWQYEPEAFSVPVLNGEPAVYLPDFYLPALNAWVEVKGTLDAVDDAYLEMIARCIDWGGALPGASDSGGTTRGLIWLFDVPNPQIGLPLHTILQHRKGGWVNSFVFTGGGSLELRDADADYFDGIDAPAESLRQHLRKYDGGRYWCDRTISPILRAAYTEAKSARFAQGGWR